MTEQIIPCSWSKSITLRASIKPDIRDVLAKMRDLPHYCGTVDTYVKMMCRLTTNSPIRLLKNSISCKAPQKYETVVIGEMFLVQFGRPYTARRKGSGPCGAAYSILYILFFYLD